MGLIKAAASAIGSTLHDQWKEYIRCDDLGQDILMKRVSTPNGVISKDSAIQVAPGQIAVVFQNGQILDATAEEGIFTFDEAESLVFHNRIAFNKHYNPVTAGLPVGKTVDDFAASGGDISIRISPLSTVFEMDVFAKDMFGLKDDEGYFPTESFFTASDVSERSDITVIPRRNGLTFVGDYVRVLIEDIIKQMKEVI